MATVVCAVSLALVGSSHAQDSIATVRPEDLVSAPQRYWARAILFKDVLTGAPTRGVRIDNKVYFPFATRTVGTCYATEDIASAIGALDLYRAYAFQAMVIQHKSRYYIIVSGVTPVVDTMSMIKEMQAWSPGADVAASEAALKPIAEIIWEVESAHLAYAREKGIPLCELYDPNSVHFPRAMELVRAAIMKREIEQRAISSEILAQYLLLALARTCAATNIAAGEPAITPAVQPTPQAVSVTVLADESARAPAVPVKPVAASTEPPPTSLDREASVPLTKPTNVAERAAEEEVLAREEQLSFWQRWKARHEQRRTEAIVLAEEKARQHQEERERKEAEERARIEKERREQKEALAAEQTRIVEEKKRAKEEARNKRLAEKAEAERQKEEAKRLEEVRKAEAAPRLAADDERKAWEVAIREKEERERADRKQALAEEKRRKREEAEQAQRAEELAKRQREDAAHQRAGEEQRALQEAARRQAEAANQAMAWAAAEARRRTQEEPPPIVAPPAEEPAHPSWWERFKERRRLAREEAARRQQAWEEFLKQEEERIQAEREARRRERELRAEEKRRAKEEAARQRESSRQPDAPPNIVLPPPATRQTTARDLPPSRIEQGAPEARTSPIAAPPTSAALPLQAPAIEVAPVLPQSTDTSKTLQVVIDLSTEPLPSLLTSEKIEQLRREEEEHYRRFRENMLREAERQERERKRLEREMDRQMRR